MLLYACLAPQLGQVRVRDSWDKCWQSSSCIIDLLFFLFPQLFLSLYLTSFLLVIGKRHPKTKAASLGGYLDMHAFFATYFAKFNPRFRVQCSTSCPLRVPFPCPSDSTEARTTKYSRILRQSAEGGGAGTGAAKTNPH